MSNAQLMTDMGNHFTKQLRRLLIDIVDTCQIADMSTSDILRMLTAVLLSEVVVTVDICKFTEDEFIGICRNAFQNNRPKKRRSR